MATGGAIQRLKQIVVAIPAAALPAGLAAQAAGSGTVAGWLWGGATLAVLAVLAGDIVTSLRRGEIGLDLVAFLSMSAALWFGETLAAAVVALMYAGGSYLESFAARRARREMSALLERLPRTAMRYGDGQLAEVPLGEVRPGDRLLIRAGDVVPVDGTVAEGVAVLDQSALTGEPMPVRLAGGDAVMSGGTNAGDSFDMVAGRGADESTYAGIVRLVEAAQASRAPMARMADRYALGFLAATVALAGSAWALTGDPIRAVAVLVVATPCPLILAVPVALVSGLSRAARYGVLVKGAKALETMARVAVAVVDKTGTLTEGRPTVAAVHPGPGRTADEVLRLAASLDQASKHPVAGAIVAAAAERGLALVLPGAVRETPGEGVEGEVGGRRVLVGGAGFVARRLGLAASVPPPRIAGEAMAEVAVDGVRAGVIVLADPLRPETAAVLAGLRSLGIGRLVLATGDREEVARAVCRGLPIDRLAAGLTPDRKVLVVLSERKHGPVMMVGDGINDAPALAASDLGVAMGARGAAASAEAADVVLLVDDIGRLLPGLEIARGARRIAMQSIFAGLALSGAGMVAAALGYLPPVAGAVLQEAIDVAVILNALRVLRIVPRGLPAAPAAADVR